MRERTCYVVPLTNLSCGRRGPGQQRATRLHLPTVLCSSSQFCFGKVLSSTRSIYHPHCASHCTCSKWVRNSQTQEHRILQKQTKSLWVPHKNTQSKENKPNRTKTCQPNNRKKRKTKPLSSSFGQLAASLWRGQARKVNGEENFQCMMRLEKAK